MHGHEHHMRATIALAEAALERGELPIAARVVLGDTVLAEAATAEVAEGRLLVHAELRALDMADRIVSFPERRDVVLYTNLEPCLMCLGAAMSFGVGAIHYALESASDGAVSLARGWQRDKEAMPSYRLPEIHGGLLRNESIALFARYVALHDGGPVWDWARTLVSECPSDLL